jgi:hypothetical protein
MPHIHSVNHASNSTHIHLSQKPHTVPIHGQELCVSFTHHHSIKKTTCFSFFSEKPCKNKIPYTKYHNKVEPLQHSDQMRETKSTTK